MASAIVKFFFSILCIFNIHPSQSATTRKVYHSTGRIEETTVTCDCCGKVLQTFKENK